MHMISIVLFLDLCAVVKYSLIFFHCEIHSLSYRPDRPYCALKSEEAQFWDVALCLPWTSLGWGHSNEKITKKY